MFQFTSKTHKKRLDDNWSNVWKTHVDWMELFIFANAQVLFESAFIVVIVSSQLPGLA